MCVPATHEQRTQTRVVTPTWFSHGFETTHGYTYCAPCCIYRYLLLSFTHLLIVCTSVIYIQIHMQIKHKLTSLQTCSTMCIREISARVVVVCIYSSCYSTWRDRYTYTTSSYAIWSKGRQDREKTSDSPTW